MRRKGWRAKRQQVNEVIARLEPDNLHALSYLGKQLFAERRFVEAQQTWEKILQQDATRAEAYLLSGGRAGRDALRERPPSSAFQRALSLVTTGHDRGHRGTDRRRRDQMAEARA